MTESEAMKLLALLKAAHPRAEVQVDTLKLYASNMLDIDFDVGAKAVRKLIRTSPWFPSIAEIRSESHAQTPRVTQQQNAIPLATSLKEFWEGVKEKYPWLRSSAEPEPVRKRRVKAEPNPAFEAVKVEIAEREKKRIEAEQRENGGKS